MLAIRMRSRLYLLLSILAAALLDAACAHRGAVHADSGPVRTARETPPISQPARRSQRRAAPPLPVPKPLGAALTWPVSGRVTSAFATHRRRHTHGGIDISAPQGTGICAAERGLVAFSGTLRGYGNVVILKHRSGLQTLYAHNRRNRVRRGQAVGRGEVIDELGSSGHSTAPHLHFEVLQSGRRRDPVQFLEPRTAVAWR